MPTMVTACSTATRCSAMSWSVAAAGVVQQHHPAVALLDQLDGARDAGEPLSAHHESSTPTWWGVPARGASADSCAAASFTALVTACGSRWAGPGSKASRCRSVPSTATLESLSQASRLHSAVRPAPRCKQPGQGGVDTLAVLQHVRLMRQAERRHQLHQVAPVDRRRDVHDDRHLVEVRDGRHPGLRVATDEDRRASRAEEGGPALRVELGVVGEGDGRRRGRRPRAARRAACGTSAPAGRGGLAGDDLRASQQPLLQQPGHGELGRSCDRCRRCGHCAPYPNRRDWN